MRFPFDFWLFNVVSLFVICSHLAHAQSNDVSEAFNEAVKIAEQRWQIPSATLKFEDGQNAAATKDGIVLIGRDFASHFMQGIEPANAKTAMRFVMLHELVHVAQKGDIPDTSPGDPSRKRFECQADMLATTALLDSLLLIPSNQPEEILSITHFLKQFVAHTEQLASGTGSGYIDKRGRILAIHFGFIRTLHHWLATTKQQGGVIENLRSEMNALTESGFDDNEFEWSMNICKTITRSDANAVTAAANRAQIIPDGNKTDIGDNDQLYNIFKYVIENTSPRTLIIQSIALSGSYPVDSEGKFEDYEFSNASYNKVEIPPHSKGEIGGKVTAPKIDSSQRSPFFWTLPYDPNLLISAAYVGKAVPDSNCNSGWGNLGSNPIEQMVAGLVRIGMAAQDGFSSIQADPLFPGISDTFFKSTISVPGATSVTLFKTQSNPSVDVMLYQGDDFDKASHTYESTAMDFKKLCSTKGVMLIEKDNADHTSRRLTVKNLTGYSSADLQFSTKKETDRTNQTTLKYRVDWMIFPTD